MRSGVTVDVSKRDGLRLACNLCGPCEKFIHEGILIVDELGWLYFIGPICGKKFYQGEFLKKVDDFNRTENEEIAREYLLSHVGEFRELYKQCVLLMNPVVSAQVLHGNLRRLHAPFSAFKAAIERNDGWLRVENEVVVLMPNGDRRKDHRFHKTARIKGAAAVLTTFKLSQQLSLAQLALLPFSGTEDEALYQFLLNETHFWDFRRSRTLIL